MEEARTKRIAMKEDMEALREIRENGDDEDDEEEYY